MASSCCDLLRIEAFEQLTVVDRKGGDRGVHDLEALIRQLDDDATTIVRIRQSTHQSAALEPIDPARHAGR